MNHKYSICCIILSWITLFIGLYLGLSLNEEWFSRLGAIVVFFAVASEYSLVQLEMANLYGQIKEKSLVWNDDGWGNLEISVFHKRLSILSHITTGIGTVIWGFGDLFV